MSKLNNKLVTKPSKETGNKKTLQFSNPAIEKYLPTFGNSRHIKIAFKVPLKSHLKGLKLGMSKATKKKYFVLYYWFQSEYHPYTLGTYGPSFGVKQVSDKLFDIVEEHTNDKGLWLKDPKITKKDEETKITKSQFKNSQRKVVYRQIKLLKTWLGKE